MISVSDNLQSQRYGLCLLVAVAFHVVVALILHQDKPIPNSSLRVINLFRASNDQTQSSPTGFVPDLALPELDLPALTQLPKHSQDLNSPASQSFLATLPQSDQQSAEAGALLNPAPSQGVSQFLAPAPSLTGQETTPTDTYGGPLSVLGEGPLPVPAPPPLSSAVPLPNTSSFDTATSLTTDSPQVENQSPNGNSSRLDGSASSSEQGWFPGSRVQPIQPIPSPTLSMEDFTTSLNQWLLYHRRLYDPNLRLQRVTLNPKYPKAACRDRLQGKAVIPVLVNPNGKIEIDKPNPSPTHFLSSHAETFVQDTGHIVLNDAAIAAVKAHSIRVTAQYQALLFVMDFRYSPEVCNPTAITGQM